MPNYFEQAAQDRGVSANKKPNDTSKQPQNISVPEINPTLQRVMSKRVQKPDRKSYTFYLRCDLVDKLNLAADQAGIGTSNLLDDILRDIFGIE